MNEVQTFLLLLWRTKPSFSSSSSQSNSDANVYIDTAKDIIYVKFTSPYQRGEDDLFECIGGMRQAEGCPMLAIKTWLWKNAGLTLTDGDCRNR